MDGLDIEKTITEVYIKGLQVKLEVGEFYLTEDGRIIKIQKEREKDLFLDEDDYFYNENGVNSITDTKRNIIAHIPKELHWSIVSQIYSYYSNINARNKIIKRYKNFFNKKTFIIPS